MTGPGLDAEEYGEVPPEPMVPRTDPSKIYTCEFCGKQSKAGNIVLDPKFIGAPMQCFYIGAAEKCVHYRTAMDFSCRYGTHNWPCNKCKSDNPFDGEKRCVNKRQKQTETVDHPQHYGGDTTYEVIKVLEAWGLDKNFCLGNAVKYIARFDKKGAPIEDLEKAAWYLKHAIDNMKQGRNL